ncbi:MAG TPA: LysR family transcriptional regulator [Acidimicrobiales bacterium]
MDIRQLRAVVAVVEHHGVTRAAEELHVAQPSLSQTIQSLEREVGVELFHRVGRRLVLSAAGEALLGPARQVLRDMATVAASVAEIRGLTAGRLDLVAEPTLAVDPVARLIGAFRVAHPKVVVHLAEPEGAAEVVQRLADGRSELGLAELPMSGPGLITEEMEVQDVLVVRPPGSEAMPAGLAVGDLAGVPLVTTPIGTSSRALVERTLAAASVTPVVAVETGQREALLPLVLAGAGTALLPRPLAEEAGRRGAVVADLRPPLRRSVGLVYRRAQLSPAARAFVELARRQSAAGSSTAKVASSRASQSTGVESTAHASPSKRTTR